MLCPDNRPQNGGSGRRIFLGKILTQAENFFRVLFPDFIISNHWNADFLLHGRLIPWLAHTIAVNRAGFHRRGHLRWRCYRQGCLCTNSTGNVTRCIIAGLDTTSCQPVTQFVIMRGNRENHSHFKLFSLRLIACNDRLQDRSADRMLRFPVRIFLEVRFNLGPDFVRQGDRIAIEVERERGDQIRLGAIANRCSKRLPGQHVCAVQLTTDHAVEQHFPVCLRFECNVQPFFGEKSLFFGNRQRGHIGELDESELQGRLFNRAVHGIGLNRLAAF